MKPFYIATVTVTVTGPDQKQVDAAMRKVSRATRPRINALLRLRPFKTNNVLFTTSEHGARPA